jgi:hypothetical protein
MAIILVILFYQFISKQLICIYNFIVYIVQTQICIRQY